MSEESQIVVDNLSSQILHALRILRGEEAMPGASSDRSEDKISYYKKRVEELRRIRIDYENVITQMY